MKLTFENGESIEISRKWDGSGCMIIKIGEETITPNWIEAGAIVAIIKEIIEVYS